MPWEHQAACRGVDAAVFYGTDTVGPHPYSCWLYCDTCPVVDECRSAALAAERGTSVQFRFGQCAFTSPSDRARMDVGQWYEADGRHCGTARGYVSHRAAGQQPCAACTARWRWYVLRHRPAGLQAAS